jgi:hypothetical protein
MKCPPSTWISSINPYAPYMLYPLIGVFCAAVLNLIETVGENEDGRQRKEVWKALVCLLGQILSTNGASHLESDQSARVQSIFLIPVSIFPLQNRHRDPFFSARTQ